MSQDDSSSTDSADLCQTFFSLNLNRIPGQTLNGSNLDSNAPSTQSTTESTDQAVYFHPASFNLNKSSQSTVLYNSIEFSDNSISSNEDQPIVPSISQNRSRIREKLKNRNPLNEPSFDWDSYLDRNQVLKKLRNDKKFVDVQLIADDGHSEYVHSTFISTLGKEFTDFIFSLKEDPKTPCAFVVDCENNPNHIKQIKLTGITGPALKVIVDSVYTGYIETDDKKIIWSIINLADRFGLTEILKACCTHLIYHLNIENCVKLLHLGIKLKHRLRTAAWNFIRLKFDRIVNECSDYVHLTIDELVSLLDDDHLNTITGEQIVWQGICRWILADLINRAQYLKKLLEKLRFGRLPSGYLEDVIANEPLLIEINNGSFNESKSKLVDNGDFVNNSKLNCNTKLDKKSSKDQNLNISKLNDTSNSKCLNLINQMIAIRKNKENQFKTDSSNLLIDLSPYYVKPRIPAEVIFVVGGWQDNMITTLIETYDSRTNMWFESYIALKYRAYHRIEVLNGLLYIIGGTNGAETLSTMHCFNPNSGKWYVKTNMHERRCYVSTTIVNDLIYAMGGHNGAMRLNSAERYDYKTNQWSMICPMNLVRSDASAVAYQNKIYIAGGLNEHVQNTVEFYNPDDNTWTFIQPMYYPRNSLSLVLYGGYLFALGGSNGAIRLNSVEKYDFNTGNWSLAKPMRSSRSTFSACILEDKLYVVGGHNHHSQIKSVEYYDLHTDKWYEVKSLKKTRSGFAICTYRSFKLSRKFTYTHYAEQQLIKSKKSHLKKKSNIKNNEQSNNQSNQSSHGTSISMPPKDNSSLNQYFNGTNMNRFRVRRTQVRPSFSVQRNAFDTRNLLEINSSNRMRTRGQSSSSLNLNIGNIDTNTNLSADNSNEYSRENQDTISRQVSNLENDSTSNQNSQVVIEIDNANDQESNSRNQENQRGENLINQAPSSNRRSMLVVGPSSSDLQMPTIRVKSYPSMTRRFFQTRSLNNARIPDRENDENSN